MYPDATIPVLQISIDYSTPAGYRYNLARELTSLRKKCVLIIENGSMVHTLRMMVWDRSTLPNHGYDWAIEMHELLKEKNHCRQSQSVS